MDDTSATIAPRVVPRNVADLSEAERLAAAQAEIEALRRARRGVPATRDAAPAVASPGDAPTVVPTVPTVGPPAPTGAVRPRGVRPRGVRPRTAPPRTAGRSAWRTALVVAVPAAAVLGFLAGRAGAPTRVAVPTVPSPAEASMRARIAELEAETNALQRELLRLELEAVASTEAALPVEDEPPPPLATDPSGGVDAPLEDIGSGQFDVPIGDSVENRTYGAVATPPSAGD